MNQDPQTGKMEAEAQSGSRSAPVVDPELWLDDHGDVLYRFALARLRNTAAAEDLV